MRGAADQYVSEIADHVDVCAATALDQRVDVGGGATTSEAPGKEPMRQPIAMVLQRQLHLRVAHH